MLKVGLCWLCWSDIIWEDVVFYCERGWPEQERPYISSNLCSVASCASQSSLKVVGTGSSPGFCTRWIPDASAKPAASGMGAEEGNQSRSRRKRRNCS